MSKTKNKKKKYIIIGIILLVIVALYLWISNATKQTLMEYAKSSVIESSVQKGNIEVKIKENGVIEPNKRNEVFAQMGGTVTKQYVNIGDNVKKDETIFKIGGYSVKSPIAGEILWTNIKVDDYVQTVTGTGLQQPIAIIADMSRVKFKLYVDELDINKVKIGMEVEITADGIPNKEFKGVVEKINLEGVNKNGITTYEVEVVISEYGELKIGMNVDSILILESKQDTLIIPMAAINKSGSETYVYVKDDEYKGENKMTTAPKSMSEVEGYKKQTVTVGISNKDYIEVIDGLKEGDKVYNVSTSKSLTEYMVENGGGMSIGM